MFSFPIWQKRVLDNKWSRHAFNCSKCPREGCPAWYDTFNVTNPSTGISEEYSGCQFMFRAAVDSEQLHWTHKVAKSAQVQNQLIGKAFTKLTQPKELPLIEGEILDDVPE
jgi:hypothetical protein